MRPVSVRELLNIWECGLTALPFEKALYILSIATPECSREELCRLPVGHRDQRLFRLRQWAFGSKLQLLATCPKCRQMLETSLLVSDLCDREHNDEPEVSVEVGDYQLRCRAPNSEDLMFCVGSDFGASRRILLRRCIRASYGARPVSADDLPEHVSAAAEDWIAGLDPQANLRIDLICPDCVHSWSEPFDIVSFFWSEIDAWARRLFRQVHTLASAYGWNEDEVLALSPTRREIYLAMART
jgi:hypothetical protein